MCQKRMTNIIIPSDVYNFKQEISADIQARINNDKMWKPSHTRYFNQQMYEILKFKDFEKKMINWLSE